MMYTCVDTSNQSTSYSPRAENLKWPSALQSKPPFRYFKLRDFFVMNPTCVMLVISSGDLLLAIIYFSLVQ